VAEEIVGQAAQHALEVGHQHGFLAVTGARFERRMPAIRVRTATSCAGEACPAA
jgi:hypothetical protein